MFSSVGQKVDHVQNALTEPNNNKKIVQDMKI